MIWGSGPVVASSIVETRFRQQGGRGWPLHEQPAAGQPEGVRHPPVTGQGWFRRGHGGPFSTALISHKGPSHIHSVMVSQDEKEMKEGSPLPGSLH